MGTQKSEIVTEPSVEPCAVKSQHHARSIRQVVTEGVKAFGISVGVIVLFILIVLMVLFVIGKLMPPQP